MYKPKFFFLVPFILSAVVLPARTLSMEQFMEAALKGNIQMKQQDLNLGISRMNYGQALASRRPLLKFTTDSFEAGTALSSLYYDSSDYQRFSTGAGLSLAQPLPTGGSLQLSAASKIVMTRDEGSPYWSQAPEIGLSIVNPVFSSLGILDFNSGRRVLEKETLRLTNEDLVRSDLKNRILLSSFRLAGNIMELKALRQYYEQSLVLNSEEVEIYNNDRKLGRISESELLGYELTSGVIEEQILSITRTQEESEIVLAHTLGMERIPEIHQDFSYRMLGRADLNVLEKLLERNYGLKKTQNDYRSAVIDSANSALQSAPALGTDFSIGSSQGYTEYDSLTDSFTALGDSENLDWELAFSLNFTLSDHGAADMEKSKLRLLEESALNAVRDQQNNMKKEWQLLMRDRNNLLKHIGLIEQNMLYNTRLEQREKVRQEGGLSRSIDVKKVTLEIARDSINLRKAQFEVFLNGLELLNLAGIDIQKELLSFNMGTGHVF